ncbi:hypothetical protein V8C86DRAFT_2622643 [Haematococcus lacustris]
MAARKCGLLLAEAFVSASHSARLGAGALSTSLKPLHDFTSNRLGQSPACHGLQLQPRRCMAAGPDDSTTPENTWAQFRALNGFERKNDLSNGIYALMALFSYGYLTSDFHIYPPRVIAMAGMILLVLYTRKH